MNFRRFLPEIHVCPAGPDRHLNLTVRLLAPLFVLAACAFAPSRAEERRQIRAALFVPDPLPALQAESYGEIEIAPGVTAERVSYATDYGLRVPAIVYRPTRRPAGKMPGLIVVNGHGGDKYSWYAFYAGILYARAGATVVTYDPIGEGERNAERQNGTRQHDREVEPAEMGRRMGGLLYSADNRRDGYRQAFPLGRFVL